MNEGRTPGDEYERRLELRKAEVVSVDQADSRVAWGRLVLAGAALVIAWLALGTGVLSAAWLWVPILGFIVLLVVHERLRRRRASALLIHRYLEGRLRRIRGGWAGDGPDGSGFLDSSHPYAADLDLFGRGSLFQLLSVASTPRGEALLASWLTQPADAEEIAARQEAVRELAPDLDLREDLAPGAGEWGRRGEGSLLLEWAAGQGVRYRIGERILTSIAAAAATITLVGWLIGVGSTPFFIALILAIGVAGSLRKRMASTLGGVTETGRELEILEKVLARIERRNYQAPLLRSLIASSGRASDALGSLRRLTDLYDATRNQFFAPIGALILWNQHLAFVFESWRHRHGAELVRWIEAVATFEALESLAAHAWEHPDDTFPELTTGAMLLELEGAGHPLLTEMTAVRNDLRLDGTERLFIVSGSNMSGKSTLLRTVGTNVVLAQCGSVVRARRMKLTPFAIGASIRLNDSLEEGASRFYAEIRRLRQIVDLAGDERRTLLALLDEVLAGTNSHDRRIGAQAILRKLVEQNATGLVTTHDLALTRLAEDDPRIINIHFEDRMEGDRMEFDYRLKPGVVTRSNAIALMRAVGLEV